MANPLNRHSIEGATGLTTGSETRSRGHPHLTVFAALQNFDPSNDEVAVVLEASPDRVHWDDVTAVEEWTEDPDSGAYTASSFATGEYYEFLRARVSGYTDAAGGDLVVDAWVMGGGNAGQGVRGNP